MRVQFPPKAQKLTQSDYIQYTVYTMNTQPVSQHRTQVYFPAHLYRAVKEKAKKEDVSIAKIIRQAVEKEVGKEEHVNQMERDKAWEEFFKLAGIGKSREHDLSINHDKYLAEDLYNEHLENEREYREWKRRKRS